VQGWWRADVKKIEFLMIKHDLKVFVAAHSWEECTSLGQS
jgi:hypothetical protein